MEFEEIAQTFNRTKTLVRAAATRSVRVAVAAENGEPVVLGSSTVQQAQRYVQQDIEVELALKPASASAGRMRLGEGARLGWTSWLPSNEAKGARADYPAARVRLGAAPA